MDWTDRLHQALIAIADLVNRFDVDTRLLAASGVKLDRALFPLLSRVAMHEHVNVAELANVVGRDHSTVSRQIVRLEELGLIRRTNDPGDQRSRHIALSESGREMMDRVGHARRQWMEEHFASWKKADRDQLVDLLSQMLNLDREREAVEDQPVAIAARTMKEERQT